MLKRALWPAYELQQRMKALEGPLAVMRNLEKAGTFGQLASLQNSGALSTALATAKLHSESIKAMQARASAPWMLARPLPEARGRSVPMVEGWRADRGAEACGARAAQA